MVSPSPPFSPPSFPLSLPPSWLPFWLLRLLPLPSSSPRPPFSFAANQTQFGDELLTVIKSSQSVNSSELCFIWIVSHAIPNPLKAKHFYPLNTTVMLLRDYAWKELEVLMLSPFELNNRV
jgi:hypothetical protein